MQNWIPRTFLTESTETSSIPEKQLSTTERRELFSQFLKQRQIKKKRKIHSDIEIHNYLEESDNLYDVENVNMSEERDEDFVIEDESVSQWK